MIIQNEWEMTRNTMAAIENSALLTICDLVEGGFNRRRPVLDDLKQLFDKLRERRVYEPD